MALPGKVDQFLNMKLPMWVVTIVLALGVVVATIAGPPVVALISKERAVELIETHCAAPLAALELKLSENCGLAIRDLNIDNSVRFQALEEKYTALVILVEALKKQVCVLMAQRAGGDTDECFKTDK